MFLLSDGIPHSRSEEGTNNRKKRLRNEAQSEHFMIQAAENYIKFIHACESLVIRTSVLIYHITGSSSRLFASG
jgi:hypothetical protein